MINNTDSLYPKIIPVQYPKAGETNLASRLGVVDLKGGETRWFKLPGDSRDFYLARMGWAANSEEIVFQRLNRLQNTIWLMLGNIQSGKVKTILTEKEKTWGGLVAGSGLSGPLMDGGNVSSPGMAFLSKNGKWLVENVGVPPDIDITNHPGDVIKGIDSQLEKAVQVVLDELKKNPAKTVKIPKYPDKTIKKDRVK